MCFFFYLTCSEVRAWGAVFVEQFFGSFAHESEQLPLERRHASKCEIPETLLCFVDVPGRFEKGKIGHTMLNFHRKNNTPKIHSEPFIFGKENYINFIHSFDYDLF